MVFKHQIDLLKWGLNIYFTIFFFFLIISRYFLLQLKVSLLWVWRQIDIWWILTINRVVFNFKDKFSNKRYAYLNFQLINPYYFIYPVTLHCNLYVCTWKLNFLKKKKIGRYFYYYLFTKTFFDKKKKISFILYRYLKPTTLAILFTRYNLHHFFQVLTSYLPLWRLLIRL